LKKEAAMNDIHHEVAVAVPQDRIIAALETPAELAAWNGGTVRREGDVLQFDYAKAPRFRWRVTRPGSDVVAWDCLEGPGDSVGTTVRFTLVPADRGRTRVELVHAGWPHRDGNWRKCNTHWGALMHALRRHLEGVDATGPVFR
jgi:hypothetical protein